MTLNQPPSDALDSLSEISTTYIGNSLNASKVVVLRIETQTLMR